MKIKISDLFCFVNDLEKVTRNVITIDSDGSKMIDIVL